MMSCNYFKAVPYFHKYFPLKFSSLLYAASHISTFNKICSEIKTNNRRSIWTEEKRGVFVLTPASAKDDNRQFK